jgi:hypothetical protein
LEIGEGCGTVSLRKAGMTSAEQFRDYAADCVRVAQQLDNPIDRATLLQMAKVWRDLAVIAEKNPPVDARRRKA